LTKYVPEEYEQPININSENVPDSKDPILLETSLVSPIPAEDLHIIDPQDLFGYPMPQHLYKKLQKFTFIQKNLAVII